MGLSAALTVAAHEQTHVSIVLYSNCHCLSAFSFVLNVLFSLCWIAWWPSTGFMEFGHEIISTAILSLPLIQEGQLSVTGERMGIKYW